MTVSQLKSNTILPKFFIQSTCSSSGKQIVVNLRAENMYPEKINRKQSEISYSDGSRFCCPYSADVIDLLQDDGGRGGGQ